MALLRRAALTASQRHRARWWLVVLFLAGLMACGAALLALAFLLGRGAGGPEPVKSVLKTLSQPAVASVVAFALLVVAAWCFRRFRLEWLAWRPGSILVPTFVKGSALTDDAAAERLTMQFRRRLARLRLQSPAAMPTAATEQSFVDVLSGAGVKGDDWFATLVGLLAAASPTHSYRIEGALVERDDGEDRYGVSVQVFRLPSEASAPAEVWATSWERAVQKAADAATAAILPRTRQARGPWATWRRYLMPAALVSAHEDAVDAEAHGRFDEALDGYYRALREDPMNYSLRVRLGQLQEKLGMFLAALDTYDAIRQATRADDYDWLEKRIYSARARRQRRREALTARYRCTVLLTGGRVVEQWLIHEAEKRDPALDAVCERLSVSLKVHVDASTTNQELTEQLLRRAESVSEVLARRLFSGGPVSRRLRHGRPATIPVSAHAVRVIPVYIAIRRTMLDGAPWNGEEPDVWIARELATAQEGLVGWGANYNAACCYALPLKQEFEAALHPDPSGERRDKLAQRAFVHLERACASADSGFIAARRDWLLKGDPDLEGLRHQRVFKEFEARYMAVDELSLPPMVPDLYETSSIRYATDLLTTAAEALADGWRRHAGDQLDINSLLDWWREERVTWGFVGKVALHYRDPHARMALLEWTRGWCLRHGIEPLESRLLRHEDARHALERSVGRPPPPQREERLPKVAALVPSQAGGVGGPDDWFLPCESVLRECAATNMQLTARAARRLCRRQVALWTRLGDWLEAPTPEQQGERERDFQHELGCKLKLTTRRVNGTPPAAGTNGDRPADQQIAAP